MGNYRQWSSFSEEIKNNFHLHHHLSSFDDSKTLTTYKPHNTPSFICKWIYTTRSYNTHALRAGQGSLFAQCTELLLSYFLSESVLGLCLSRYNAINNISPGDWNLLLKRACTLPFLIANVKPLSVPFVISSRVVVFFFNRDGKCIAHLNLRTVIQRDKQ